MKLLKLLLTVLKKHPVLLEGPAMGLNQYLSPSPDFDTGIFALFVFQTLTKWRNMKHV